jgi:hypothetical protein
VWTLLKSMLPGLVVMNNKMKYLDVVGGDDTSVLLSNGDRLFYSNFSKKWMFYRKVSRYTQPMFGVVDVPGAIERYQEITGDCVL